MRLVTLLFRVCFGQPVDASLVSVGIQVAPDTGSSNNTPELPMVCAVVDMNASEYSVKPDECESKDKLDAEDCGGLMNDMSCGNVECVTLSDNEDVDFDPTLVLDA